MSSGLGIWSSGCLSKFATTERLHDEAIGHPPKATRCTNRFLALANDLLPLHRLRGITFPVRQLKAARQNLTRCIERAEGVGLLVGPAGTGKTLLCHVLAEEFRGRCFIALLDSGRICTRRALLQAISFEIGLPFRGIEEGDLRLAIVDRISPRKQTGEMSPPLVVLVDEAHALPLRLVEELRLLSNTVRNGEALVRVVLAGSPALEERLASPKLESFNQRISARCYLEALDRRKRSSTFASSFAMWGAKPKRCSRQMRWMQCTKPPVAFRG